MKKVVFLALCMFTMVSCRKDSEPAVPEHIIGQIRPEHPRLFLTKEDIPAIKNRAQTSNLAYFNQTKKDMDKFITEPFHFDNPLVTTPFDNSVIVSKISQVAMLYLITEDTKYLDYVKKTLPKIVDYYHLRIEHNLNIDWYVFSQISVLCAYDWVYNSLTPAEREQIGRPLYNIMTNIAWHGKGLRPVRNRENTGDIDTGFYGTAGLPYYIGIAFHKDGFDDVHCEQMFQKGLALNWEVVNYRRKIADANGGPGVITACMGYAVAANPVFDFNFIRSYHAATGVDIKGEMNYVLKYLDFIDWNRLPKNKEFGLADSAHYDGLLPEEDINYHLREIATLYGNSPDLQRLLAEINKKHHYERMAFMPFLQEVPKGSPSSGLSGKGTVYYKGIGELIMRSGTGDNDTYAVLVTGAQSNYHKHFDNNHFTIYRNGYRALDTGTRPEPSWHLSHYYPRTVAHNCITIRMPNEQFPLYWGIKEGAANEAKNLPIPNDGGQYKMTGSVLKEMRTTNDYVYVASDATESYNSQKTNLVMREFIYFYPDLFVIFDRVNATNKNYPKKFLLHTINEPVMKGSNEFSETSREGKMICRTLYPTDAVLTKVGGTGKDFWSDGRNWPLPVLTPQDYGYNMRAARIPPDHPELGHWRVEVSPKTAANDDYFMHLLQVGDLSLSSLPNAQVLNRPNTIEVQFTYNGKHYTLTFDKTKTYGCSLTTTKK